MHTLVLNKHVRLFFTKDEPLCLPDAQAQVAYLQQLEVALKTHKRIDTSNEEPWVKNEQGWPQLVVSFGEYKAKEDNRYRWNDTIRLRLRFGRSVNDDTINQKNILFINVVSYYRTWPCAVTKEQLLAFVEYLDGVCQGLWKQDLKRDKVKNLKHQAIQGRIKAIAAQHQLHYQISAKQHKTRVSFRCSESCLLTFDIRWSDFQTSLQYIDKALELSRSLDKLGIVQSVKFNAQAKCGYMMAPPEMDIEHDSD